MKHDINYYKEKMFGGIAEANSLERDELEENAIHKAWEIRNFEIDLYWRRTAYFWAFNTAIAVAYYNAATGAGKSMFISSILLILGIVCSIAWFLANIASKHWQENWENHINLLEDSKYGRIYKTTMSYYEKSIKPSVSRLNLKISVLVILAWIAVVAKFCITSFKIHPVYISFYLLIIIRIIFWYCKNEINIIKDFEHLKLRFKYKDYENTYMHSGTRESVNIIDTNE